MSDRGGSEESMRMMQNLQSAASELQSGLDQVVGMDKKLEATVEASMGAAIDSRFGA